MGNKHLFRLTAASCIPLMFDLKSKYEDNKLDITFSCSVFCCFDSVKANPLRQDTIRDVTYQLYPLGVACRDNDMATIKRLLAGKDEPMAMGNDFMSLTYSIRRFTLIKRMY